MSGRSPAGASPPDRHVLLVGGAGYIGSVLGRELLARGYRTRVLDALLYGHGASLAGIADHPEFSLLVGDLCEEAIIDGALDGITDVVLLGALVGDPVCRRYPRLAKQVNLEGSRRLVDRLDDSGIERFVFLSTCSNYGLREDAELASERAELRPLSLYAETKVAMEQYILEGKTDLRCCRTVLRLATAYGLSPRMRFDLTLSQFARELTAGRELVVYDPDTWRPYCHVRDISRAIVTVLESPRGNVDGEVFNVGSNDEQYTKRGIVDIILDHVKGGRVAYRQGDVDPRNYRVSFDKIAAALGYRTSCDVRQHTAVLVNALRSGVFDDVEDRKSFYGNHEIPAGSSELDP